MITLNSESQTIEFDNAPLIEPKLDGYHRVRIRGAFIHKFGTFRYEMGGDTALFVSLDFVHPSMGQQKNLSYWICKQDALIDFMREFNISPNKNRSLVYEWPGHTGVVEVRNGRIRSIGEGHCDESV